MKKEHWAKSGRPCSGKTPTEAKGSLGSSEVWLVLPTRHAVRYYTDPTPPMLILARFSHEVKDNGISGEVKIGKIGSQGSSLR